jgi:hypothetical protein
MRLIAVVRLIATVAIAHTGRAQGCTARPSALFENRVEFPVMFVSGDTTMRPRFPSVRVARSKWPKGIRIQFVVDSLGRSDPRSLILLQVVPPAIVDSVRFAMVSWRFTPAVVGWCNVPQVAFAVFER